MAKILNDQIRNLKEYAKGSKDGQHARRDE